MKKKQPKFLALLLAATLVVGTGVTVSAKTDKSPTFPEGYSMELARTTPSAITTGSSLSSSSSRVAPFSGASAITSIPTYNVFSTARTTALVNNAVLNGSNAINVNMIGTASRAEFSADSVVAILENDITVNVAMQNFNVTFSPVALANATTDAPIAITLQNVANDIAIESNATIEDVISINFEVNGVNFSNFGAPIVLSVFNTTGSNLSGIRVLENGMFDVLGGVQVGPNFVFATDSLSTYALASGVDFDTMSFFANENFFRLNGVRSMTETSVLSEGELFVSRAALSRLIPAEKLENIVPAEHNLISVRELSSISGVTVVEGTASGTVNVLVTR